MKNPNFKFKQEVPDPSVTEAIEYIADLLDVDAETVSTRMQQLANFQGPVVCGRVRFGEDDGGLEILWVYPKPVVGEEVPWSYSVNTETGEISCSAAQVQREKVEKVFKEEQDQAPDSEDDIGGGWVV